MRKQITSLLLTLAMLLSLVPTLGVTASAAEGDAYYPQRGIQTYQDFSTLLASQVTMQIKLLKDIEYTLGSEDEEIVMTYSQMLDLNGHKITIDASKRASFTNLIHLRHGNFTLYDSKGGGEIAIKFAPDSKEHSIIKINPADENAPPTFTMNGGTLTRLDPQKAGTYLASNGCISDDYSYLPWTTKRPQITINGGTINCPYDWDRSQYSKDRQAGLLRQAENMPTALLLRYSQLTVNGGTFNGIVWTEDLTWSKEDTEPRVSLNGGVFNYPFAVTALPKNVTQMVIDGAHFQDGFYVGESKTIYSFHAENDPPLLLKSGEFDSHGKNPKLGIYNATAVQKTENIDANKTSHTVTIPKGADPKVYSFDLHLNLEKNGSFVGIISNEHIVKLVVSEAPEVKTLTGKASYINSAVFGKPVLFSGTITPGVYIWECQFQWQRSTDGGSTWKDIPDATDGQYIPGAADMGENVRIRVVITKEGYLGEIVSTPAKVSKAANDNTPSLPNVTAQKNADGTYTAFQISNFKSDQEYIYTTSAPTSGNGWPTGGTPITSATVNGLNQGSTYYIFTRYKDTDTHQTGSKVSSTSVLLDEITMLNRVSLTDANGRKYSFYGSGNIIYIKKGESMTLTAKTNPVGATTWSGFTFKSQYNASAPFTVTAPTGPVASGSTIPSVTIRGDTVGTGTLAAEYGGYPAPQSYGTWRVHVYENVRDIGTAADIIVAPSFPDLTMRPGETMPLPEYAVSVYPKGALDNYTLEWRIIKVGSGGAAYSMRDDHMTLENGKIEPTKAHTGSEKTRLELVAVNKTKPTNIRSLSPSVGFYITVGDAPLVELTGLTLTPKKVDLEVGKTCQLSAVKEPANAEGSLTWTSSKPAVAAVDKSGKVTAKGEGTATITVTCGTKSAACTVTVSKPLVPEVPGTSFTDVPAGAYYEEAVGWAVEKGITKGTSDSTFTPDGVCTRAQAVTFLWRAAGSPAAKAGSQPFADVKAGSYYDDAVRWAVENGVTVGTSATTFSPNATCSRAQIVTFLWRAQKSPAAGSANPFDDVAGSAYYADAVQWAVQKDITKGTGATAFSPDANCIRAQIVTFLYRSMK